MGGEGRMGRGEEKRRGGVIELGSSKYHQCLINATR